ncbi:MAG: SMC-Scp complex subunit ScpB [Lachnospiraceae bacterium]|nr:SMC-Scp complex subunit ScpB [Lachnospiraceae bacterium]MBR5788885.1 SMC-Scp complex subunit ScpB [Lachnospiraceae bacterium]
MDGKMKAAIEAILFSFGDTVSVGKIATALDVEKDKAKELVEELAKEMEEREDCGLRIVSYENAYQMCTKEEYYDALIKINEVPRKYQLTDVLLETLSIIAYKQPITRIEVEKIRGVACDHAINKLIEYKLVQELGRLDAPGRPLLFGTTEEFLRTFGVRSIDELPTIKPDQLAEFKEQAEREMNDIKTVEV